MSSAASATLSRSFSAKEIGLGKCGLWLRERLLPSPPVTRSAAALAASTGSVAILIADDINFPNINLVFCFRPTSGRTHGVGRGHRVAL